jgi:hypothetical protein
MIGLQVMADQIRAQQCANAERSHTAWVYPQSKDEPKLVAALSRSAENPNTFRPWLIHHQLGQVANVWMGVLLFRMRRKAEALDRFDEVLSEPVVPCSEGFFERYPLPVPFNVSGVDVTIPLSRSVAAIYAAVMYQMNCDFVQAKQAVAQAEPSDLVAALKTMYAFNLEEYNEVLQITHSTPNPAETSFEALALIFRGSAIREIGKPAESLEVISGAAQAAAGLPDIINRLNFEVGRSYAAMGCITAARNRYNTVRWCNADFPELDEAMAALTAM